MSSSQKELIGQHEYVLKNIQNEHTPLDHWTPIAGGDDSDATAEAIAACAGIAPFNSLQG